MHSSLGQDIESEKYVAEVGPYDVLLGRGTGPNNNQGNVEFRISVEKVRDAYTSTPSRKSKNQIVQKTVEAIKAKRGRFLNKLTKRQIKMAGMHQKKVLYEVATNDIAVEKTKQALRYVCYKKDGGSPKADQSYQKKPMATPQETEEKRRSFSKEKKLDFPGTSSSTAGVRSLSDQSSFPALTWNISSPLLSTGVPTHMPTSSQLLTPGHADRLIASSLLSAANYRATTATMSSFYPQQSFSIGAPPITQLVAAEARNIRTLNDAGLLSAIHQNNQQFRRTGSLLPFLGINRGQAVGW
jgi:hypothetical protein